MGKEPETQASTDMERVRLRVYTVLYTRKTAVKDAAGAAQRAKILDGRIFPSPAPHSKKKDGFSAIFFYRKLMKQSSLTAGFQIHLNFRLYCNYSKYCF